MQTYPHRRSVLILIIGVVLCWLPPSALSQQQLSVPRPDGHTTPLVLYPSAGVDSACAPLAVISHGAGSSEYGYRYLAETMSRIGYTTVVMGHRESGMSALRADIREYGLTQGLRALVADPAAEQARLLDVGAALKWADGRCAVPFRILLGHSMGAETVMLEAGARNMIGVTSPPAGQDRFDAYVALSPEGPGIVFPKDAWSGIHKPIMILTGTRDESLKGGPQARLIPWHNLPGSAGKCQWMGVIDGATHMNFAGNGPGYEPVAVTATQTITAFLEGVNKKSCTLPPSMGQMKLQAK